jgi:hypothetical protein
MSYLLTLVLLVAAGLAILDLLRMRTGHAVPDAALGWLAGSGWLAAAATPLRFLLHVPFGRPALLGVALAPIALWGALRVRRRAASSPDAAAPDAAEAAEAGGVTPAPAARWVPRPAWLFAPLALYVVVMAGAVILHGTNTPTHTDDAVRVRAFAPMLAFDDAWSPEARNVFGQASPLSTFVPAVAWILTGTLDHFHVNYAVLTELVALLALAVGLGSARGDPERGWAGVFAVLSVPLFVYHCTSTYSDAVLAMRIAGGVLLLAEYGRTRDRRDLSRAALLLGIAAMVKREGELVAAAPAAVLVAQLAWERWRGRRPIPWRALCLLVVPGLLVGVGKIAALGLAGAFPMVGFVAQQAVEATAGGPARPAGIFASAAQVFFVDALFRSGNAGMLYWILVAVLVARARSLRRPELGWPLLALAALFAEVAVSSIFLAPTFTLDQGTVNRALLVVSVPAALWVAAAIVDAAREAPVAEAVPPPAPTGSGEGAARPRERRRRSPPASRR